MTGRRRLPERLVADLAHRARADRWHLSAVAFEAALVRSAERGLGDRAAEDAEVERYLSGLHLEDLALACACAEGSEAAWDHFVSEFRPVLYRAASALDPSGDRELADSLYGDLFGTRERDGERQPLFTYFQGRSSLATWLRAVLAQRHVDRMRAARRVEPLPEEHTAQALRARPDELDPDRARLLPLAWAALRMAIAALAPRDRLRFACYYADGMTLAETGRVTGEHEATVSRQLTKTRAGIRTQVERHLKDEDGLDDLRARRAIDFLVEDAGAHDLAEWMGRKKTTDDRSTAEDT